MIRVVSGDYSQYEQFCPLRLTCVSLLSSHMHLVGDLKYASYVVAAVI